MGRVGRIAKLSGLALLLTACGPVGEPQAPTDLAFTSEALADDYEKAKVERSDRLDPTNVDGVAFMVADRDPAAICESTGWTAVTSDVLVRTGHNTTTAAMTSTGRGCRAFVTSGEQEVDIRLEIIAPETLADVVAARSDVDGGSNGAADLMGFEELGFEADDTRVASSLSHPELDRLEEHRWVAVDDSAYHLAVAVEPGGNAIRYGLVELLVSAEAELTPLVADHGSEPVEDADSEVLSALGHVLASVVAGEPLDDAATDRGFAAIAFEYEFPENIAGIAPYQGDAICDEGIERVECRIEAPDSIYRFTFRDGSGAWQLDDFRVDPAAEPTIEGDN